MGIVIDTTEKARKKPIKSSVQIIVEGGDECHLFEAFIEHLQKTKSMGEVDVRILNLKGKDNLKDFLPGFALMPEFKMNVQRLGIVRDADESPDDIDKSEERAFQSVRSALKKARLPIPNQIGQTAVEGDHPAVTALILPGGGRPGYLETLLCESFKDDPLNQCVDEFFECTKKRNGTEDPDDKARARVYIAAKKAPNVAVGLAAKKDVWKFENRAFEGVRKFLERVVWNIPPPV